MRTQVSEMPEIVKQTPVKEDDGIFKLELADGSNAFMWGDENPTIITEPVEQYRDANHRYTIQKVYHRDTTTVCRSFVRILPNTGGDPNCLQREQDEISLRH